MAPPPPDGDVHANIEARPSLAHSVRLNFPPGSGRWDNRPHRLNVHDSGRRAAPSLRPPGPINKKQFSRDCGRYPSPWPFDPWLRLDHHLICSYQSYSRPALSKGSEPTLSQLLDYHLSFWQALSMSSWPCFAYPGSQHVMHDRSRNIPVSDI